MGRTIGVASAEVHAFASESDPEPKLIALMQGTMMRVDPPDGVTGERTAPAP